ncbi:MAG: hypothetical protein QN187_02310 [Armatimonadota bacterium]|nr:hypothetical protein [Armatimonadota bacterium]MDR7548422.1 hypothetical protein [Armatimonadota bacterium]
MATARGTQQHVVFIIIFTVAALTGGGIVRAADRLRGVSVSMTPDGQEIIVWNSTSNTWGGCSVALDDQYRVDAPTIPVRTLLALPRHLFGAPEDWNPHRAVVQCREPRRAQWVSSIQTARF